MGPQLFFMVHPIGWNREKWFHYIYAKKISSWKFYTSAVAKGKLSHLMTKPTKWECPAKTLSSLGIRPVWLESSLCAQWVAKDPSFLHADREDSDQSLTTYCNDSKFSHRQVRTKQCRTRLHCSWREQQSEKIHLAVSTTYLIPSRILKYKQIYWSKYLQSVEKMQWVDFTKYALATIIY